MRGQHYARDRRPDVRPKREQRGRIHGVAQLGQPFAGGADNVETLDRREPKTRRKRPEVILAGALQLHDKPGFHERNEIAMRFRRRHLRSSRKHPKGLGARGIR